MKRVEGVKLGKQKKGLNFMILVLGLGTGLSWLTVVLDLTMAVLSPSSHDTDAFFSALSCAQVQMAVLVFLLLLLSITGAQ